MTLQKASRIEQNYLQWIDGSASKAASGERFTRSSPAHDVIVGDYPLPDAIEMYRAVAAARKTFDTGP